VGKPEEKSLLRRPRGNWEDNIKKYLKETVSEDLCASGYGHVAGCCECGNELPGFIKYGEFLY
jgi:hypothetical protein